MTAVYTEKTETTPLSEGPIFTCITAAAVLLKYTKASLTGSVALLTVPLNYTGQNKSHIQANPVRDNMANVVVQARAQACAYWEQRHSVHLLKHPQNKVFTEALGTYRRGTASQDTGSIVVALGTPHPSALTRPCRSRSPRIVALRRRDRRRDRAHSPGSPGPRRIPHRSLPRNLHLDAHTLRSFTVSHALGRAQRRKGPDYPEHRSRLHTSSTGTGHRSHIYHLHRERTSWWCPHCRSGQDTIGGSLCQT